MTDDQKRKFKLMTMDDELYYILRWNNDMMPVVVSAMREGSPLIIMHNNYTLISNL